MNRFKMYCHTSKTMLILKWQNISLNILDICVTNKLKMHDGKKHSLFPIFIRCFDFELFYNLSISDNMIKLFTNIGNERNK